MKAMYSLCDLETFIAIVENQGVVAAAKAQGPHQLR